MSANGILQIAIFFAIILLLTKPLGAYMARIFEGPPRRVESWIYRVCGIDPRQEQNWMQFAGGLLIFSLITLSFTYALQRLQQWFPLNPQGLGNIGPDSSFNTAVSFTTNTNWQSYTPETTMSYLTQMIGLATHNFFSAAAGVAVALALIRGFTRQSVRTIGNFWVDLTRATIYVLLPISVIAAVLLVSQGVIQNFNSYERVNTLEHAAQVIPQGPVASQEAIKELGTNGGGFFNANSAHPYENPTPISNLIEEVLMFLIPSALTYTFGVMVKDTRQGWALFAAMTVLFVAGLLVTYAAEASGNPNLTKLGLAAAPGNMEGKEVRFGVPLSSLWAVITTDTSCGAVNAAHDSLTPLGGLIPLLNIELGEVVFGGVGAGIYGMLIFAILAVFIAGLMVGRTPEYLGKKIEQKEVKMVMLSVLVPAVCILGFSACAALNPQGLGNNGPHGLSEIIYAYSSGAGNNGSAFGGLSSNTPFYNTSIGIDMLCGRFLIIIPLLAAAGSLAQKKKIPVSQGTFPTHGPLFVVLLTGTIVIVGALTFFPALSLGPVVEHFLMVSGHLWS